MRNALVDAIGMAGDRRGGGTSPPILADAASALGRLDPPVLAGASAIVAAHDIPGELGPDLIHGLRRRGVECPVLFVVPLRDAALAPDLLEAGADDVVVADPRDCRAVVHAVRRQLDVAGMQRENENLHHELTRSLVELELKNSELERVVERLERSVRTDGLTGLASRRWLDAVLAGTWAEATRHDLPLAFLMIDLDGFKALNDVAGHQAGDDVLRLVGQVLQANCRAVDTAARYGGDEFSILLPHTGAEEAIAVARRILAAFRAVVHAREIQPRVSMSIGVAQIDASRPVNPEDLVRHADEAMYAAKVEAGGDAISLRESGGSMAIDGSGRSAG
jgi:diguanylate cyclase (GGDEF)-like protein